jgi:cytoskeletal protein RodZ
MSENEGNHTANTQSSMADRRIAFGRQLADLRLKSGMSLDSLAQATRISRNFIVALESGKFEELPGDVFARGFVKALSRTMGASGDDMVRLFTAALTPDPLPAKPGKTPLVRGRHIKTAPAQPAPVIHVSEKISQGLAQDVLEDRTLEAVPETSSSEPVAPLASQAPRGPGVSVGLMGAAAALVLAGLAWFYLSRPVENPPQDSGATMTSESGEVASETEAASDPALAGGELADPLQDALVDDEASGQVLSDPPGPPLNSVTEVEPSAGGETPPVQASVEADTAVREANPPAVDVSRSNAQQSPTAPTTGAATSPTTAVAAQSSAEATAPTEAVPAESVAQTSEAPQLESATASNPRAVNLLVKAPVTIRVTIDQQPMESREFQPGTHVVGFSEKAELLILDASAVEITFNGRSLGSLGAKGRVRRLSFAAAPPPANAARPEVGQNPKKL